MGQESPPSIASRADLNAALEAALIEAYQNDVEVRGVYDFRHDDTIPDWSVEIYKVAAERWP